MAAVARFGDVVMLSAAGAADIAALLRRFAGQLPPCRERSELLDRAHQLCPSDAPNVRPSDATSGNLELNVSVQGVQQVSCQDDRHGISTAAASSVLGITAHAVRDLVRRGVLPAIRVRGRWLVDADAVTARAAHRPNPAAWNP